MARPASDIRPRLVRSALKRFLFEGVDGASLRQIASDAKTSIGMVYYYFPTKDDLFLAVVEDAYSVFLVDLEKALDPNASVEERVRALYVRIGAVTDDELMVIRLVLREALVSSSRLDRIIERFQRGHVPLLIRLIMDAQAGGTFDPAVHPVVALLSMMSLGGTAQLLRRGLDARLPIPGVPRGAELSEQMVRILFRGLENPSKVGGSS